MASIALGYYLIMSETFSNSAESLPPEIGVKIEKYQELIGDARAIFILSASEREINIGDTKKYRPDAYSNLDNKGSIGGGHARVIATAELGKYFPDVKLVTTSAPEKTDESLARIYAKELESLEIPEEQIILEEKSTDTLTELIEMIKIARNNAWESVAVLTSEQHIERASEMLNHLKKGDRVVTSSGFYAVIVGIGDASVEAKIADNVKVKLLKSSISEVLAENQAPAAEPVK